MSFPYLKFLYAALVQIRSLDLNNIQDVLVQMNGETWQPTMVGIADVDISVRRGWVLQIGAMVHMSISLTWNNTDGGTAGDDVEIDLPYQAEDYSGGGGPKFSVARIDPTDSIWTNQATDRDGQALISHLSGFTTMIVQRISTTNTTLGNLTNDTAVGRQLSVAISYPTDGVKLI